jgi:predicted DNA-binding transcriptional regulator AlpA
MTTASTLSLNEIQALPAVLDVPTAGRLLGLGRAAAYELARRGEFPTPVLRLGRQLRVPTAPLLQALGLRSDAP